MADSVEKSATEKLEQTGFVNARESATGSVTEGSVDVSDDAVLRANGHEAAMPRQFNWLSALGLGFSITNSWVGYLTVFGQNMVYGGPQTTIFSLIVGFAVQFIVTLGLSELGSAFPSSGGQYHFCYILSPAKTKRFSGYVIGWMSVLAWWIVTCSGASVAAVTLTGLIAFLFPSFAASQWQTYLIYLGSVLATAIPVITAAKRVPLIVQAALYLSITGFLVFVTVVAAMMKDTNSGSYLVESGLGTSGWSHGTAWVFAVANSMYAFGASDGAIHISEEIAHPGRRVPQVMTMTLIIGLVTALPVTVVLMLGITDGDAVARATSPGIEAVYQITGNKAVTTFLFVWVLLGLFTALPSEWVASGRLAWAFARDNGLPFSNYFAVVDPKMAFPLRTTIASIAFASIYGLLFLASSTALNSIVTSAVLYLNITYTVPQAILLFQGRGKSLPKRYLDLGYVGCFCNVFSVLWILVLGVLVCFPPTVPVDVGSMNYSSVVLVGLFVIIIALWFLEGRKKFVGPCIDWDLIKAGNVGSA